ncbi:MAG: sigma factor [Myxococcota bacterium]
MTTDLYHSLERLRAAPDPSSQRLADAWQIIDASLRKLKPLARHADRDDVRQRALIKVLRNVKKMDADSPVKARAWLNRVHRSALSDHYRSLTERTLTHAVRDFGERSAVDTLPERRPTPLAPEVLDQVLDRVLDRVDRWLEAHVRLPRKRAGDYRRAQVAILANIRGYSPTEIRNALGASDGPSDATLYKWVERGRETVLFPALEDWDDPAGAALLTALGDPRRSDAGQPRDSVRTGADATSSENVTAEPLSESSLRRSPLRSSESSRSARPAGDDGEALTPRSVREDSRQAPEPAPRSPPATEDDPSTFGSTSEG